MEGKEEGERVYELLCNYHNVVLQLIDRSGILWIVRKNTINDNKIS